MANNNDNKILNVPPLRFPEFSGEWKKVRLGEECNMLCGYAFNGEDIVEQGSYLLMRGINITEGSIRHSPELDRYYSGSIEKLDKYKLAVGDLVIGMDGSKVGRNSAIVSSYEDGSYLVQRVCRIKSSIGNNYILQLINNTKFHQYVDTVKTSSAIPHISLGDIQNFRISIPPTQDETDKIAKLFLLLDERIATQNKIIEDLKKLKSAIIEKLFCSPKDKQPEVRLHGFSDNWQIIRLSDICHRILRKNTEEQCRRVLTIAAQHGLISQEEFFNKNVASENLSGYYLLQNGDFAYNKSYSGDYVWGTVKRLDNYEQGVLSPLYICFRPDSAKVDSDFLIYYFESKKWHKAVADIAGEGARNHGLLNISVRDYFNTIHCIPSMDEQKQIAQFVSTLSSRILREQRMVNCYAAQRQYLLRQMFI